MPDRVVVIGNPASLFVQAPVRDWRRRGVDAVILTARWPADTVADGLPVISAANLATADAHRAVDAVTPFLSHLDAAVATYEAGRVQHAMRTWGPRAEQPLLAPPVADALLIASALDAIKPAAVLGHEVFAYGLATQLAPVERRALFVWGRDVLHAAWTSDAAYALVRHALHAAHYVMTCADTMRTALHERFDLPLDRIAVVSYGVDRRMFRRLRPDEAASLRAALGIPAAARVVTHLRRFLPHWGAATAHEVILTVAERRPDTHFVIFEGAEASAPLAALLDAAAERRLTDRITAIRGHVPLPLVAQVMGLSDVGLSLVDSLEPFSLSVLQAAAAGSHLVVAAQETYQFECAKGLAATLVPARDVAATVAAVDAALNRSDDDAATANQRFVAAHYDHDAAMLRQLRIVAGNAVTARLLTGGAAAR